MQTEILKLLELDLGHYERKLNSSLINGLVADFIAWENSSTGAEDHVEQPNLANRLVEFLQHQIKLQLELVSALDKRHAEFNSYYSKELSLEGKQQHILDYARDMGFTSIQLRGDREAFTRWFGHDAMEDRYMRRRNGSQQKISFYLQRLGVIAAKVLRQEIAEMEKSRSDDQIKSLWRRLDLEATIEPFLYDWDNRLRIAAFNCLSSALKALPRETQETAIQDTTLEFVYRSSIDVKQDVWIQCEALSLLQGLSLKSLEKVLRIRLENPRSGDDPFVRKHAVRILGENLLTLPELLDLIPSIARDPSPFVRQGLATSLRQAPPEAVCKWIRCLIREDPAPQVRAAALLELVALVRHRSELGLQLLAIWDEAIHQEGEEFTLRVAIHAAVDGTRYLVSNPPSLIAGQTPFAADDVQEPNNLLKLWTVTTLDGLECLHVTAQSLSVRRWAAQAREYIWIETYPKARKLRGILQGAYHERDSILKIPPGKSQTFPRGLLREYDDTLLGRVLSVLAQDDFGYDVEVTWRGNRITRGNVFRFRLWRLLHELRSPSPDKRQAYPHTIGRVFSGTIRAPSGLIDELAETKVPGEPLFIKDENGWRPYLPLVDDVISSIGFFKRKLRFFTSEGVTEVSPPISPVRRFLAYITLSWYFPYYAHLRNWFEGSQFKPSEYVKELSKLGFSIRFQTYEDDQGNQSTQDPAVLRFFQATIPFLNRDIWQRIQDYFISIYENSLTELAIFAVLVFALFFARHLYVYVLIRRARRRFPLVVGGWGTRGKSSTERLKAALFNALGCSIVSKTTGSEPYFLHAHHYGKLREMFLFRPYDKATIWEQVNVVRIADKLGVQVFLWECMGLTPAYVRVLQHQWMKDDVSTITNTYPDHEDLQGPAGINVAQVISGFIPRQSRLLTSEETMRPILTDEARRLGTPTQCVGWLEAGLITPDVLQRFPYEEHPYNVALVLSLADELGIDRDFALKQMADLVVPDIGVLKVFPKVHLRHRTLEFSNGMSANERHGCLSNWARLRFDQHDPVAEPGVWISTVVNNRADRIPRSQVFARILVNDIRADRHFLIGDNLTGLLGYIEEAWEEYAQQISIWPEDGGTIQQALKILEDVARRLRQPYRENIIRSRLRAMLSGVLGLNASDETFSPEVQFGKQGFDLDRSEAMFGNTSALREFLIKCGLDEGIVNEVISHHSRDLEVLNEYQSFAERIKQAQPDQRSELDAQFRELLWKWFNAKIVVIEDYYATGNQIINRICEVTPPGILNRIMGIQNIKGTGLDFIYSWQAWDTCHAACEKLRSNDPTIQEQGLRQLVAFQDYNLLCEEYLRETIEAVRQLQASQREGFQAQLTVILSNLEATMRKVTDQLIRNTNTVGWQIRILMFIESILDSWDAIKRRRIANQIYKDLTSERISHARAALELQSLNKRQKGGWLIQTLSSILNPQKLHYEPVVPGQSGLGQARHKKSTGARV